jgi:hypothetical protein
VSDPILGIPNPILGITKLGEKTVEVANRLLARKQLTEVEPTIQNQESDAAQQVSLIAGSTPNSEVTPSSSGLVEQQIAEDSTVTGAVTGKILEGENLTDISDNLVTSAEEKGGEEPPTAPRVNEIVAVREDGASSNDSAPAALEGAPSVLPANKAEESDATSKEELKLPPVAENVINRDVATDNATDNNSETSEESTQGLKKSDTHLPEPLENLEASGGNGIRQALDDSTPAVAQKESVEENDTEIQTARLPPSDIFINMQGTDQSVGNEDEAKEKNDSRNT